MFGKTEAAGPRVRSQTGRPQRPSRSLDFQSHAGRRVGCDFGGGCPAEAFDEGFLPGAKGGAAQGAGWARDQERFEPGLRRALRTAA